MLLAIDLHENYVDIEGVAISLVLTFQSSSVDGAELEAPEPD